MPSVCIPYSKIETPMLPKIETARLLLRPPLAEDALPLNAAIKRSLGELQRWMSWATDSSLDATQSFIAEGIASWQASTPRDLPMIIIHKASERIIGASGFNERSKPEIPMFEIGYWIDTAFTKQGLASEMVRALTQFAFASYQAARVQIITQVGNHASRRVAEKCGFVLEATLHNHCLDAASGTPADDWVFSCCKQNLTTRSER